MNKQQIIDAIEAKIKGQGNQIDIAGVLPDILSSMLELIPEPTTPQDIRDTFTVYSEVELDHLDNASNLTKNEVCSLLGITEENLEQIRKGDILNIKMGLYHLGLTSGWRTTSEGEFAAKFGDNGDFGGLAIQYRDGTYEIHVFY